ncbi:hypothetical protein HN709_01090 [Candidatus Peregrinibacteria bacterium]|jgi:hypothetical protein|nr:hypothetical protein [Candidatus Peregrinibacteria bacterium]MBT7736259.1 hypothetical protein [Candidatus Peregrinibacteria bacterium]
MTESPDAQGVQASPQEASSTPQGQHQSQLLREAGVPYHPFQTPSSRIDEEGNVTYSIVTQSPNSPGMKEAISALEARGCNVVIDNESFENAAIVKITASLSAVPETEVAAIRESEEIRASIQATGAPAIDQVFHPVEESC